MRRRFRKDRRRGFTLMEVLLVLVILAVLGSLAALSYDAIRRRADLNAAKSQIGLFKTPIQMYQMAIGSFPTTAQGLDSLRAAPGDLPNPAKWDGPYLDKEVPLDPWDKPYQYASPGSHNPDGYDVWSSGPDGVNGTDDDIGNWESESKR
jgi:general secretion pathway protein G